MKRFLIILGMLIAFTAVNAQDQVFYGVALQYQTSSPNEAWPGWKDCQTPVLFYVDMGFGFIAIQNGWSDRFIINDFVNNYSNSDKQVYIFNCVDKERKPLVVEFTIFTSGNLALTVKYTDVHYAYIVNSDMGATGYPYEYFKNKEKQETGKLPGTQTL